MVRSMPRGDRLYPDGGEPVGGEIVHRENSRENLVLYVSSDMVCMKEFAVREVTSGKKQRELNQMGITVRYKWLGRVLVSRERHSIHSPNCPIPCR
jgi:hypothetical protein